MRNALPVSHTTTLCHLKMLQRLYNRCSLFRRILRHFCIFILWQVIVLSYVPAALSLSRFLPRKAKTSPRVIVRLFYRTYLYNNKFHSIYKFFNYSLSTISILLIRLFRNTHISLRMICFKIVFSNNSSPILVQLSDNMAASLLWVHPIKYTSFMSNTILKDFIKNLLNNKYSKYYSLNIFWRSSIMAFKFANTFCNILSSKEHI